LSILVDAGTRVVVQGVTGNEGRFHTGHMVRYGTRVVAGVTPGKGGQRVEGIPVYETVAEAAQEEQADASVVFVPAGFAMDAMLEAADAGIELIVCITEGVPLHDMLRVCPLLAAQGVRLVGPNCPGLISPGKAKVGIMPGDVFTSGPVGMVSRSGTLTYEVAQHLTAAGLGQSTVVGIGGDPIIGSSFMDLLPLFRDDPETEIIVLLGEIGGAAEEEAADYAARELGKPMVAYIAGFSAPPGKRMGHAGAIVSGSEGTAASKARHLEDRGVLVARTPAEVARCVREAMR